MKKRLFALLAAVAVMVSVAAGPAWAAQWWTVHEGVAVGQTWQAPYYGSALNDGNFHIYGASTDVWTNGLANGNDYMDVAASTGADYTAHPTTWKPGGNPIPANWLKAGVSLQYDDNGDGVADGNCGSTTVGNTAGVYSVSVSRDWYMWNSHPNYCAHQYVRTYEKNTWNPGGLGEVSQIFTAPWHYSIEWYECVYQAQACTN